MVEAPGQCPERSRSPDRRHCLWWLAVAADPDSARPPAPRPAVRQAAPAARARTLAAPAVRAVTRRTIPSRAAAVVGVAKQSSRRAAAPSWSSQPAAEEAVAE